MSQELINIVILMVLVAVTFGAITYFFMFRKIDAETRIERRFEKFSDESSTKDVKRNAAAARLNDASKRRKSVEDSLNKLDQKQKQKTARSTKPPLKQLLRQAGLPMSPNNYYMICVGVALIGCLALIFVGQDMLISVAGGGVMGLGIPHLVVSHLRQSRFKKFIAEFPTAIDIMVRGVRSGLPINDCIKIISTEAQEPVASEFKSIIEAQQLGVSLPDAVQRLHESVPISETNFFAIVITIQQQAGGNLSEALSNLSTVLRDRKKMKAKIKALSAEAISSAYIIGALPVMVTGLLYVFNPDYMGLIFTEPTGHQNLMICGGLMFTGVLVMRQMINFEV